MLGYTDRKLGAKLDKIPASFDLDLPQKYAADLPSILSARQRISPFAHVTPVLTSSSIDDETQNRCIFFKCENFQKGGAFKFRGALNAVLSLSEEEARRGVVTHSSGNHAAALSLAPQIRGVAAHIVVPDCTSQCKVENVRRYGGRLYFSGVSVESRKATASRVQQETGAVLISSFNDPRVISGQGTIALEFLEQVPNLDAILVPTSGGGMLSGIAIAAKSIKPSIKIFSAEPEGSDSTFQSKQNGFLVTCNQPKTIAEGLRSSIGPYTWPVIRDLVEDVITVSDEEIISAMKMCFERLKVVVEPSGAVGLAASLSPKFLNNPNWYNCRNVGVVLCGGNLDLEALWKSLAEKSFQIHSTPSN